LREWANKLKEGEWDGDAENAREAVDEIERLQAVIEKRPFGWLFTGKLPMLRKVPRDLFNTEVEK
jgi:hypothetical protein